MPDPARPAPLEPTLLLTRPEPQAAACARAFGARHPAVPVVIAPVIAIRPRAFALPAAGALIVTSRNALPALPPEARGRVVWCVGEATARAAAAAGLRPAGWAEDAAGLIALLRERRPEGPLTHVAGEHRAADLAGSLAAAGLAVTVTVAYAQEPRPLGDAALRLLAGAAPVLLPLFSPRSARLAAVQIPPGGAPLRVVAMSAAVASAWREAAGVPADELKIAARPTSEAVLHALTEFLDPGRAA